MGRVKTHAEFLRDAKRVHRETYNYSKSKYINSKTPVIIICPIHGEFSQTPSKHISSGCGCPKCRKRPVKKTDIHMVQVQKEIAEDFIKKAIEKHGNVYDYSQVKYMEGRNKVLLGCSKHGNFRIGVKAHLSGVGCPSCKLEIKSNSQMKPTQQFIDEARNIHGYKYDYSKVNYTGNHNDIYIICPEHGGFWQQPVNHLSDGNGCPKCGHISSSVKLKKSQDDFIKDAIMIHGDKYDYTCVNYINANLKVSIKCKIHNEIFQQIAYNHLSGHGCPKCGHGWD